MTWNADTILQGVSRASNYLIYEEPFYGHFFVGMLREVTERVQTLAVGPFGGQVKLYVNPHFWSGRLVGKELQMGVLKHEVLHVVLKHIFRAKDYPHKDIFNVACDLVVNQYIDNAMLPADRLHLGLFPDLALAPEMDADYYYRKLTELQDKMNREGGSSPSWEALKRILGEDGEWNARHALWEEIEHLPGPLREILEAGVEAALQTALDTARGDKLWSSLPASLRRTFEEILEARKPVVDWRRLLRLFSEHSIRTYLQNTIRRPSRRYGTTPGVKVRRRQRILLAVDTSGSISKEELDAFFHEIYHIWKRGAEVLLVECDAAIQKVYPYVGMVPEEVHGGGGTDFDPAIVYGNTVYRPDAMIYFTDGVAPTPLVPPRYPVLWVISAAGIAAGSDRYAGLPGRKIKMT